jgi:hypothetical protein
MTWLAIGAMLASAAVQAKTQGDAAEAKRREAVQSQGRALASQNQATEVAARQAQALAPEKRTSNEAELTQDLTNKFEQAAATPITAQGVQIGSTIPDASAGGDYLKAKAQETAKAVESNRNLASIFGRIGGAQQLRRNEAVGFGDAAGEIGRIGAGANNMANIDQIGIDAAGQPSLGGTLAASALGAYGSGKLSTAGVGAKTTTPFQTPLAGPTWLIR